MFNSTSIEEKMLNGVRSFNSLWRRIIWNRKKIYHERKHKNQLKSLKKKVKETISSKEISLDDIALNTSNSNKVQISVPSNYFLKVWAVAEGRDLSSVAFQCLETGIREMKSKGSIPSIAINRYDYFQKRIKSKEVNNY